MNLNTVFHYKPSILGYHYFWKHPYSFSYSLYVSQPTRRLHPSMGERKRHMTSVTSAVPKWHHKDTAPNVVRGNFEAHFIFSDISAKKWHNKDKVLPQTDQSFNDPKKSFFWETFFSEKSRVVFQMVNFLLSGLDGDSTMSLWVGCPSVNYDIQGRWAGRVGRLEVMKMMKGWI